jgi:hypothetical protein
MKCKIGVGAGRVIDRGQFPVSVSGRLPPVLIALRVGRKCHRRPAALRVLAALERMHRLCQHVTPTQKFFDKIRSRARLPDPMRELAALPETGSQSDRLPCGPRLHAGSRPYPLTAALPVPVAFADSMRAQMGYSSTTMDGYADVLGDKRPLIYSPTGRTAAGRRPCSRQSSSGLHPT